MDFSSRRVLITGGAKGAGRAMVQKFHDANAHVIALDKDLPALEKLKQELPRVETVHVDLLNWEETNKIVCGLGKIHHLVNNAGTLYPTPFQEMQEKDIDFHFGVNYKPVINVSQCMLKSLDEEDTGCTIVNIASAAVKMVFPYLSQYCATKTALVSLTKSMAVELAAKNIRVNSVCPTGMRTPLAEPMMDQYVPMIMERQCIKRLLATEELADVVLFLSSSKSSMITGVALEVDGGLTLT